MGDRCLHADRWRSRPGQRALTRPPEASPSASDARVVAPTLVCGRHPANPLAPRGREGLGPLRSNVRLINILRRTRKELPVLHIL